jgi:hypothetical protein
VQDEEIGDVIGLLEGDFVGTLVGINVGMVVPTHDDVKNSATTCLLHVLPIVFVATTESLLSRRVSLADERRHMHWLGSAGSDPQYLLRMTTLSILVDTVRSTIHHALGSLVWENVLLIASIALNAAKLLLLFNKEDWLAEPPKPTLIPAERA